MVKNVCIPLGKSVQYNSGDRLYLKKIESSKRGNESVDIKAVIRLGTANSQGHAVRRFHSDGRRRLSLLAWVSGIEVKIQDQ